MVCRPYHFKFFKGFLPQILLGLFLNTLAHLISSEIRTYQENFKTTRGRSKTAATSKMELFVIIVKLEPLPIITKCSILDAAAVLDPPLTTSNCSQELREVNIALFLFFKYRPKLNIVLNILSMTIDIIKDSFTFKISAHMQVNRFQRISLE